MINAIGKQEAEKAVLLNLDYPRDLWREKEIRSVANVTRADVREFVALQELRRGQGRGAKVLRIGSAGAAGS